MSSEHGRKRRVLSVKRLVWRENGFLVTLRTVAIDDAYRDRLEARDSFAAVEDINWFGEDQD